MTNSRPRPKAPFLQKFERGPKALITLKNGPKNCRMINDIFLKEKYK